ncbi:hypothetical protein [Hydrogenophaga laconesensis]|uniref:Uncharacterized protein n=1 Tax=Hydrogenophaga laconesensis TaxID=1805971 RepID=A0ABU1VJF8_9BURK|nr:hypothetical protein [Hydrogenophaga laconesensis]MDR7097621.1 hypothetical protein [Hydrogenophaga laconesensis]
MRVLRDSASIRGAGADPAEPSLSVLITRLIADLDDEGCDLTEMVRIVVVEPGDALETIDAELGFPLLERPLDVIETHDGWIELTMVLSDDGSGIVVYVPVRPGVDARLLAHCQEAMS